MSMHHWAASCCLAFALWAPSPGFGEDALISQAQLEADWLRQDLLRETPVAAKVTCEQDAAGGCDGVKDGKWGFHTLCEANPWWQVDLGAVKPIERIVIYNRCESGMAERASRLKLLVSDDGKSFREIYQHGGETFFGKTDAKPLAVAPQGAPARFVRVQIPAVSYLHLDEVEVYATGAAENIALHKPATQSSVSEWSRRHEGTTAAPPIALAVQRGRKLAADLLARGADVRAEAEELERLAAQAVSSADPKSLYLQIRGVVRRMALKNPLLDFDSILFVKAAPGRFPHMSDQFYGWWSRPGGGVYVLSGFRSDRPQLRSLASDLPEGSFLAADLSFDGTKAIFAYARYYKELADVRDKVDKRNVPEDSYYHVFEVRLDGSGLRQLTRGRYHDFNPKYLPNGDIVFCSTRKGQFLQCSKQGVAQTAKADLPDSFVRCGGDNYRPVPVFTLHAMDGEGSNLRPISAFENFEWTPSLANDGRILYTRWDYIDRFNGHFFSLWSTNTDGSNAQLVYGNHTVKPQVVIEAQAIPGSEKLVFTAAAHHSITGGSLVLLDRNRGMEEETPLKRLTPEVVFPETEGWPQSHYANPHPLSEEHYLVCWCDRKLPPHCRVDDSEQNPANASGIYLYDAFGNLNLLYRDPAISSMHPVAVRRRPAPPAYPAAADWEGPQEGRFLVQDVYQGLPGVPRGTIKRLRVVAVPPKPQPLMNTPMLGVSHEDPGKFVLGTVPVAADGSAFFRVPSGIPVFFQTLDEKGLTIQTMRSLSYVVPGQTLACVGCHEHRDAAPNPSARPLAALGEPSDLKAAPEGSWPLDFAVLVQPVLDRNCVSCHAPASKDAAAARLDLTAGKAYGSLMSFAGRNLEKLAFERDRSAVGETVARNSRLWKILTTPEGHAGVKLDAAALERLSTWMDTYAHRVGHYSDAQAEELRKLRASLREMLED